MKEGLSVGFRHPLFVMVYLAIILIVLFALPLTGMAHANPWEYGITQEETEVVNQAETSAVVDTENREIRLPRGAGVVAFAGEDVFDYIVMVPNALIHYNFNGQEMVDNNILSVKPLSNPLAAATSSPYPDVVVAQEDSITHYSFTGEGMHQNPVMSVSGFSHIVSVGSRGVDIAALDRDQVNYYAFDGSQMVRVPALSIEQNLSNPIDFALFPDSYDCIVLDGNRVRYFSAGSENPALAVTGIEQPRAIAAAEGWFAVVSGSEVKGYRAEAGSLVYDSALSVTSGLSSPSSVALRPNSRDMLVVDGDEVKYYMFDGTRMIYNPTLSATVHNLRNAGAYAYQAVVQSKFFDPGLMVNRVRVRAYHELPPETSVTWEVTACGDNWITGWRVRQTEGAASLDVYNQDAGTWHTVGPPHMAYPDSNTMQLWIAVPEGNKVGWRATLTTNNPLVTPKVIVGTLDNKAVIWEAGNPPEKPVIELPDGCYLTSTPELSWSFSSPDPGDYQTAFELIINPKNNSDYELNWHAETGETNFRIPTSTEPEIPGPLWALGDYEYIVQLRVFGRIGVPSDWSDPVEFCVLAFDRPRVHDVASQPVGHEGTVPLVIAEGMTTDDLPRVKAGSLVRMKVDTIGPIISLGTRFPYDSGEAAIGDIQERTAEKIGVNSRWEIPFWTDASLEKVPSGTVVRMELNGYINESTATDLFAPPYSDGVVVTQGSVYEDWYVVLKGRD